MPEGTCRSAPAATMARTLTAVYPGTFDPITNGHADIIARAVRLVDRLVIGVSSNVGKAPMFTLNERLDMVREDIEPLNAAAGSRKT